MPNPGLCRTLPTGLEGLPPNGHGHLKERQSRSTSLAEPLFQQPASVLQCPVRTTASKLPPDYGGSDAPPPGPITGNCLDKNAGKIMNAIIESAVAIRAQCSLPTSSSF